MLTHAPRPVLVTHPTHGCTTYYTHLAQPCMLPFVDYRKGSHQSMRRMSAGGPISRRTYWRRSARAAFGRLHARSWVCIHTPSSGIHRHVRSSAHQEANGPSATAPRSRRSSVSPTTDSTLVPTLIVKRPAFPAHTGHIGVTRVSSSSVSCPPQARTRPTPCMHLSHHH